MVRPLLALIVLIAIATGSAARAEGVAREDVERALREGILEVWFPRIIDDEHGGFLCDFDYRWRPSGRQPKTIVFQARSLWLASQAAMRYPDDPRYLQAAEHGFEFLRSSMWDDRHGGWYWQLDRAGQTTREWGATKHAYGISFGIYGSAAYYKATRDPEALELARRAFLWLEVHAHDAEHGGYYEFFDRDGGLILRDADNPVGRDRDSIGTRIGYKSMNTHIHLLEAFTELYKVWPDELLHERTSELLHVIREVIVAPPGAMHQFFNPDWTPVPDLNSIGHNIETAYLLVEAAEALGREHDQRTLAVAKSMVDLALDYGWDHEHGGFFEAGGTFGPVHDRRKVWWSQAEALNALLLMERTFPDDPRRYGDWFARQWNYVREQLMDHEHGDWYSEGLDQGGDPRAPKASQWKAGYHNGRALLNAVQWLGPQ